jgi:hypothetical protein
MARLNGGKPPMTDTRQETCPRCGSRSPKARGRLSMGSGAMPNSGMYLCDDSWHTPPPQGDAPSPHPLGEEFIGCFPEKGRIVHVGKCSICAPAVPPVLAEPPTDKSEYSSEYPDPKNASSMSTVDLIEWIAQIAYDGKDWGWIKDELMRRFPVPAESRSAEQFYKEWAESNPESLWATKRPAKVAIAFAEAYAQSIREQLAAAEAQAEFAEDVATNLRERLLSAQKEIAELKQQIYELRHK